MRYGLVAALLAFPLGCALPCGDGVVGPDEACDDGNTNPGDGCSPTCQREAHWSCTDWPGAGPTRCTPVCGDGFLVGAEVCDDGNLDAGDGCSPTCLVELDDAGQASFACAGEPSQCVPLPPRAARPIPPGAPFDGLPEREWVYREVAGTQCADGSPTGLFLSRGSDDLALIVASSYWCADASGCRYVLLAPVADGSRSRGGSVSAAGLPAFLARWNTASTWTGSILARDNPDNPWRDFTFAVSLGCTADVQSGDADVTYDAGTWGVTVHHRGHANLVAFLGRLAATWPHPAHLVVSGGLGSLVGYDAVKRAWPGLRASLVNDSTPLLAGLPLDADWRAWNLGAALDDVCPECASEPWALYGALARRYPDDRKAVLSFLMDPNQLSSFYPVADATYVRALLDTATTALEPARWKWYFAPHREHFLLWSGVYTTARAAPPFAVSDLTSAGVPLTAFLRAQLEDDPAWSSVTPP